MGERSCVFLFVFGAPREFCLRTVYCGILGSVRADLVSYKGGRGSCEKGTGKGGGAFSHEMSFRKEFI